MIIMGPKDLPNKDSANKDHSHRKLNHKEFGNMGEDFAEQYLIRKGFEILSRNYRTRIGEIDLIVRKDDFLVFVEVKTRKTKGYGQGFEAVNYKKQQTLRQVANQYLAYEKHRAKPSTSMRFDVIDVFIQGETPEMNHIENAF